MLCIEEGMLHRGIERSRLPHSKWQPIIPHFTSCGRLKYHMSKLRKDDQASVASRRSNVSFDFKGVQERTNNPPGKPSPLQPISENDQPDYSKDKTWRGRVFRRNHRKVFVCDKQRLIYEAQRAACTKEVTRKELEELRDELDKQISLGEKYRKQATPKVKDLTKLRQGMRQEEKELDEKVKKARLEYLRAKDSNIRSEKSTSYDTIGDDADYDIAIECLTLEIEALRGEVDYMKAAYGIAHAEDEEEENFEEPPAEEPVEAVNEEQELPTETNAKEEPEQEQPEVDEEPEPKEEVHEEQKQESDVEEAPETGGETQENVRFQAQPQDERDGEHSETQISESVTIPAPLETEPGENADEAEGQFMTDSETETRG